MKKLITIYPLALTILILISACHCSYLYATVWNATSDFSVENGNPNGVWSYGWMDTGFTAFTLYQNGIYAIPGNNPAWYTENSSYGNVWENATSNTLYGVSPGQLSLQPGNNYEPSVVRWTAPDGVSGTAAIEGHFLRATLVACK